MRTHRILNVALTVVVVSAWLYLAAHFDAEAATQDLRHQAGISAEQRFAHAAQAICGPNAGWSETGTMGEVVCKTKRGHKAITAEVSQ